MGSMEQIKKAFGKKKSLYEILGVAKDAAQGAIRKAYFRLALTCHPDKCPDDEAATAKFQALSIIHATLSDEEKRKLYDQTGEFDDSDESASQSEKDWYDYYRGLFPKVTVEDIESFKEKYQGSDEERADILRAYLENEGRLDQVIDNVMLAEDGDEERFREVIEAAIKAKEVKRFKAFKASLKSDGKRKAKASKEAEEADELLKAIQAKRGPDALTTMAAHRRTEMSSFFDDLEQKYATSNKGKGGKKKGRTEPSEEEFEALQAKISAKKNRK